MNAVTDAVILMAGTGSRLRTQGGLPKPLTPLLGRPLISRSFEALKRAGIQRVCAVVGFEHEMVSSETRKLIPDGLRVDFVLNREWEKQNGVSLLAARGHVTSPFLLTMSDHLFDDALLKRLITESNPEVVNLAVDHKITSVFDLDDATKVLTAGNRIIEIDKHLTMYDAIDTGAFVCPERIFEYLRLAQKDGDCSLSDGVRAAADDGKAHAIDIGDAWWQDVDTPEMFAQAEKILRARANSATGQHETAESDRQPEVQNPLR